MRKDVSFFVKFRPLARRGLISLLLCVAVAQSPSPRANSSQNCISSQSASFAQNAVLPPLPRGMHADDSRNGPDDGSTHEASCVAALFHEDAVWWWLRRSAGWLWRLSRAMASLSRVDMALPSRAGMALLSREVVRLSGASSRLWVLAATPASRPLALSTPNAFQKYSMIPYSLCFPGDDFVLGQLLEHDAAKPICVASAGCCQPPSRWQRDSVFNSASRPRAFARTVASGTGYTMVSSTTSSTATR